MQIKLKIISCLLLFSFDGIFSQKSNLKIEDTLVSKKPLDSVSVKGFKKINANKFNKQSFSASQFEAAKGGTAIDLVKNLPSVSINNTGTITLRGSTGIQILMNGKPVQMDASTILSQIPANDIENIELLTAPSSNFDADGRTGIINLITKKGKDDGYSLAINSQAGLPCINCYDNKTKPIRFGSDINLGFKNKKWELYFSTNYQRNDIAGSREGTATTFINNVKTNFPSIGERSYTRENYSIRTSANYYLSENNAFNVGFLLSEKSQYRRADLNYNNSKTSTSNNTIINSTNYFNENLVKKFGRFILGNIDFSHIFKNKSNLTSSILYEHALLDGFTNNLNQLKNNIKDSLEYSSNTGYSPLNAIRIKTDYSSKIGEGKIEVGTQYRNQYQTGKYQYLQKVIGTNQSIIIPEFSDNIVIINNISAIYFQYYKKKSLLEYSAGLRYEYANRTFKAEKISTAILLEQHNLFPTVNIQYQLENNYKLKGSLTRRVQRNTNNELNPYMEREHSETLEQGDPYLLPELSTNYEIGWSKEWDKGSFVNTLYHQRINNVIARTNNVFNDSIIRRLYTNAGNANLYGMEAALTINITNWWQLNIGTNIYHYSIRGSLFNNTVGVNNSNWVFSLNTNQNFKLQKTLSCQLNFNYLSDKVTAQGSDSYFFQSSFSLKKSVGSKLIITAQWQNIAFGNMKTNQQSITTSGNNFYTSTNYIQETNVVMLNLGFNLNKKTKKVKLPVSEFGEKEF